jgi:hypothetical protein
LLRDATRQPGKAPLGDATVHRVVALTCSEPPGEASHWIGRAMARHTGVSLRSVQRIWAAHDLQPHRIRTFKRSNDPEFAAKLEDIVGLYVDPPAHSLVLSIDEKSQIQALDRTQPGLPLKPGKAGTMTHHSIRNGITTLFAALNVLDPKPFTWAKTPGEVLTKMNPLNAPMHLDLAFIAGEAQPRAHATGKWGMTGKTGDSRICGRCYLQPRPRLKCY